MELPFYLMSLDSPGSSWDGLVSLHGNELHFELKSGEQEGSTEFDIPLEEVRNAEFERGLVSRTLRLTVESDAMRRLFPAGVAGEEVQLMVARDDAEFGAGRGNEGEFERLVGEIAERRAVVSGQTSQGLAS